MTIQDKINEFRTTFGLEVAEKPRVLDEKTALMHIQMIRDEFERELVPALLNGDLLGTYDGAVDCIVYLIGLMSDAGLPLEQGIDIVHRSNMSKLDPVTGKAIRATAYHPTEPEGKVLKGPNFFPPEPYLQKILDDEIVAWENYLPIN